MKPYTVDETPLRDAHLVDPKPASMIADAVKWCLDTEAAKLRGDPLAGDVLVFLAGAQEIETCGAQLGHHHGVQVCPLHATVLTQERGAALRPAWRGYRKVILATNIAESSLTIDGVTYVIDFCRERRRCGNGLQEDWVSKPSSQQRRGRAGRTQRGVYLAMMLRTDYERLAEVRVPEMQLLPLASTILYLFHTSIVVDADEISTALADFPSEIHAASTRRDLDEIAYAGLLVDGKLTLVGDQVASMALPPDEALALVSGALLGVGRATAVALAPLKCHQCLRFFLAKKTASGYQHAHGEGGAHHTGDIFALGAWFESCLHSRDAGSQLPDEMGNAVGLYDDYMTALAGLPCVGLPPNTDGWWFEWQWPLVDFALACGLRNHIVLHGGDWRCSTRFGETVTVAPNSMLDAAAARCVYFGSQWNKRIHGVSPCLPLSTLAFGGMHIDARDTSVILDRRIELQFDWQSHGAPVLALRSTFETLLNQFVSGSVEFTAVSDMRRFLEQNSGIAACTAFHPRLPTAVSVTYDAELGSQAYALSLKRAAPNAAHTKSPESGIEADSAAGVAIVMVPPALRSLCRTPIAELSPCNKQHLPKSKHRRDIDKYVLFKAASDKCLRCVRQKLEESPRCDPHCVSDTYGWTLKDYAADAGATDVLDYLNEHWPSIKQTC